MKEPQIIWLLTALVFSLPLILRYILASWKQPDQQPALPAIPKPRVFKPKTDKDCPCCQARVAGGQNPETVCDQYTIPWSMRKKPGGKKKSISTAGYFCSNPCCYYYLNDDPIIHALVGFGTHGKYETIQDLRCQFCCKKFTVRRHTVLYSMKTLSTTVAKVLHLLALGLEVSAAAEAFGLHEMTIRTWLARGGDHGQKLQQRFFANLELSHVQLDELWANVKQAKQDVWVWIACDAKTKIIPVLQLGPRTQEMAVNDN